jgi:squalene-hopene/tetraprenyl-beta-curcumene cyclase
MSNPERLRRCYELAAKTLLDEATTGGHWEGELSASPLSTATAVTALELVGRQQVERTTEFEPLIQGGLQWLIDHQNEDGGWGDTILSHSNISTTTLAYASFHLISSVVNRAESSAGSTATTSGRTRDEVVTRAKAYIDRHGGFDAIRKRYGKDHTFSVPILTQCALAGLIPWQQLTPLPFELGSFPHWFYRWIHLPVVSYALPALIAIGQARHHHAPSRNPFIRFIRQRSVGPTLKRLESIQPESGGFLEATPLTSFVTMSLASMGRSDHPVARRGVDFLKASVRSDGSWPIDTNLATWVTTLSVNALLPESLPKSQADSIAKWLLGQQHRIVHRYTNAAPGGWAWTDLSGGVPDADDTPGALLALLKLNPSIPELPSALVAGVEWLLDLQNRDGGWPTFCRGWGALPFDRSTADLTAHTLRALRSWINCQQSDGAGPRHADPNVIDRVQKAVGKGFAFLAKGQRPDGTWFPLWFGNQFTADEENPVYGVSRVLAAYRDWNRINDPVAKHSVPYLNSPKRIDVDWIGYSFALRQKPFKIPLRLDFTLPSCGILSVYIQ